MLTELTQYGIAHIGFIVKDREKAVEEITTSFGVDSWTRSTFRPDRAWSNGEELQDFTLNIAIGTLQNGACTLEVIEPCTGGGIIQEFVDSGHKGLHHFAFFVQDFDYWKERFQKAGAKFIFETETEDDVKGYRRCLYVQSEELGCPFEILEQPHFRK